MRFFLFANSIFSFDYNLGFLQAPNCYCISCNVKVWHDIFSLKNKISKNPKSCFWQFFALFGKVLITKFVPELLLSVQFI